MKILIVGFGNIGCRHAQSLIKSNPLYEYYIIEPNNDIFLANLHKIGVSGNHVIKLSNISSLPNNLDFAIVATSAIPRYQITKELIAKGIKYFLLEKVVFQSEFQFDNIIKLIESNNCKAYCNFVNRYFPNYIEIKNNLNKNNQVQMFVNGGDFGLGCNSLHYIDLFEYLTDSIPRVVTKFLKENLKGNRRGTLYKELLGQIVLSNLKGDSLCISAEENQTGGTEVLIIQNESFDILNEETKKHIHFDRKEGLLLKDFDILYTSFLTNVIVNEIISGTTLLPSIKETKNNHIELFKIANITFGLPENELCPIT